MKWPRVWLWHTLYLKLAKLFRPQFLRRCYGLEHSLFLVSGFNNDGRRYGLRDAKLKPPLIAWN